MKCKICDCDTKSFNDPQLNKHYYHCLNCDCIALDPTYFLSLEKENALYNNHQNSLENSGYVKMFEDFLDYYSYVIIDDDQESVLKTKVMILSPQRKSLST